MSVEYYCFVKACCRFPHMVAAHVGEGPAVGFFSFFWGVGFVWRVASCAMPAAAQLVLDLPPI
jgi:hypothetical protein